LKLASGVIQHPANERHQHPAEGLALSAPGCPVGDFLQAQLVVAVKDASDAEPAAPADELAVFHL
jgi:hypothetical protein